eukprot:CAMPEP_0119097082 /NCGR_PEP_ID=MMETSP1178-20130426/174962_1 /TAXON_ID=33656 /ORGANISM="unid sp, Strain CCMP2000" /LENGTH=41 /DNA_ID= /DNA_START= /DNA_END= /DNA_ORIENTATION=
MAPDSAERVPVGLHVSLGQQVACLGSGALHARATPLDDDAA